VKHIQRFKITTEVVLHNHFFCEKLKSLLMFMKPLFSIQQMIKPINEVLGFFFSFFLLKTHESARKKKKSKKNKLFKRRLDDHVRSLRQILPFKKIIVSYKNTEILYIVSGKHLFFIISFLRKFSLCQYTMLTCISGVDYLEKTNRFEITYHLLSLKFNHRINVRVFVNEVAPVPSIVLLYSSANWWERELWDMFGIYISNHPDLRRILTDYGFEGFPLRKDFPLTGFIEVRFDNVSKRVICEPLELTQEYRSFDFQSPWTVTNKVPNINIK
jgi:NADH-quinone oxidoreductase subunit C